MSRGVSWPTGPRFAASVRHDYNNDSELSNLGQGTFELPSPEAP